MKKIITIATASALALSGVLPMLAFAQESGMPQKVDETGTTPPPPVPARTIEGGIKNIQMMNRDGMNFHAEGSSTENGDARPRQEMRHFEDGTSASTTRPRAVEARQEIRVSATNKMIDMRIEALQKLSERIGEAKHLSDDQKTAIEGALEGTTQSLNSIKDGVSSTTDGATLKADVEQVRKANRVYALVIPQTHIQAAADRQLTIITQMETLGVKLSARIAEMKTAGKDTTKEDAAYADYTTQLASAKVASQAAVNGVSALRPDNGVEAVATSNRAALKAARESLGIAQKALKAARADITVIYERTKGRDGEREKNASTTANGSASANVSN